MPIGYQAHKENVPSLLPRETKRSRERWLNLKRDCHPVRETKYKRAGEMVIERHGRK